MALTIMTSSFADGPTRFEIMDTSGNRPTIKVRQSASRPTTLGEDPDEGYFVLFAGNESLVRIDITGSVTSPDVYFVNADNSEVCEWPQ